MSVRLVLVVASCLLANVSSGCRASGGASLVLGGSSAPQHELLESVQAAAEECAAARTDFTAAFHLYQRLTAPQAVELEELSEDFEDALETCQERNRELVERVESVQLEAAALFKGWNDELARFSGDTLRKKSESMLKDTEERAERVLAALERVRAKTEPVLLELSDYALFFHHNLNARAIATLGDTYKEFDAEFRALEAEFDRAHTESDAFLAAYAVQDPAATPAEPSAAK